MTRLKSAVLAMFFGFAFLGGAGAQAQSVDMNAFYGRFEGMGVAEDAESIYFETTVRELAVEIRPNGNGAIKRGWVSSRCVPTPSSRQ